MSKKKILIVNGIILFFLCLVAYICIQQSTECDDCNVGPSSCDFGSDFRCDRWVLDSNGSVFFRLENMLPGTIFVNNLEWTLSSEETWLSCDNIKSLNRGKLEQAFENNTKADFACADKNLGDYLVVDKKQTVLIRMSYYNESERNSEHQESIVGIIYTNVR